ncbi:vacuolar protein sorting/targeting protein PEP1 [Colletotrichum chrysophilum]|uniref:vacuolar protein sorting/targeting protein PEP1 n=1 Tax=Colletotrichum chrysophilum TaxID=1836956 RepID=UPI002300BB40|nr:vacuolar protein sorting/targeting protein PEP1 [Colletotrichum chrysophilum]KAJ0376659.1 vacuolar protein sorting/targeting protein PEP1 [Colletotrichum chrysophilum]
MRLGDKAAASWRILLSVLTWTAAVHARDDPTISVTTTKHPPAGLSYFEDSDVILYHDISERNIYRTDDAGVTWNKVKGIPDDKAALFVMHEFDKSRAYVLTETNKHYRTTDKGKTWNEFDSVIEKSFFQGADILHFHAGDPDRIIFGGMQCAGIFCQEVAMYTTDNFKSKAKPLRNNIVGCWWAKSSTMFTTGQKDLDEQRILCIALDKSSTSKYDYRLFASDNYFEEKGNQIQEFEPNMDTNKGVSGVVNLAVVKKYLMVATSSPNTDEMALFVTDDTIKWHRAMFPAAHGHKINQDAYTVLESTNYSIQVDVVNTGTSNPMGVMFTSNSNGTFFIENIEHTNRNRRGHVDFEKITGVQGVFIVNVVKNAEEVEKNHKAAKEIITKITFDDGRNFHELKAGSDNIHLHSVTDLDNVGRVFSSPAPGLVLGIGNTGKSLGKFEEGDVFVSDDAGVTWKKALDGPHKYEFGDQGSILVAVKDSYKEDVSEVRYSLDHGESWKKVALPNDLKIKPELLTTTQDSTSLKFLLVGRTGGGDNPNFHLIALDFEGLHERTCKDDDMEDWHARPDDNGKPTCLMGHKQTYRRRKKTADCFIKQEFKDPVPVTEDCECTDADFECDYNFVRKEGKCEIAGPIIKPDGACKNAKAEDTFKGTSGWRLIPGNTCKRKSGAQKDDPVERKCGDTDTRPSVPVDGKVKAIKHTFDTKKTDFEKFYLERGETNKETDETIIVRPIEYTSSGQMKIDPSAPIWRTKNHGKDWDTILKDEKIYGIYPHNHFKDTVFFTTDSKKVMYTIDHAEHFHHFDAPTEADTEMGSPLSFHPDKKDWLIWVGKKCEKDECWHEASITKDRGDNWHTALRYVRKCEFTGNSAYKFRDVRQIVCLANKEENNDKGTPKVVVSSNDFFEEDKQYHQSDVSDFATMAEFIVVAVEDKQKDDLKPYASLDGVTYAEAHFPVNFKVGHKNAYTVLDSSTHAVNLFVATSSAEGRRYGSIIKSNSNGTSYVQSAAKVNCDDSYYVDFEKIAGLEGVALINTVINSDKESEPKKVHTQISHNDGAQWAFLPPPRKDAADKNYECSSNEGDEKCALHLHHYTERTDKKKTFSAATAVGVMFGNGNVGSSLGSIKDADTFMSTDAGITWKSVAKGVWTWQYGDQGSIIVLVQRYTTVTPNKSNVFKYSTNGGKDWEEQKFDDNEVKIMDITTVRSGSSRNFLLWCKSDKDEMFTVDIDFTSLTDKPCKYEKNGESDYYTWSPKHPMQADNCLFGHVTEYLRKREDRNCFNDGRVERLPQISNCTCTRPDFECDYNFELDNHKQCSLVPGKQPMSAEQWCKENPDAVEYYEPTGYRRIPLTTCVGGQELDKQSQVHACAGKEDEFERRRGTSGVAIFFAVIIPVGVAAAIGWWVYNNWNSKFGQIRLGESPSMDSEAPWVKYPVIALSAAVAVVSALPLVASAVWRSATSAYERVSSGSRGGSWLSGRGNRRFTTRDSFARGRGDYAVVDDDEGELLGDESDDEV